MAYNFMRLYKSDPVTVKNGYALCPLVKYSATPGLAYEKVDKYMRCVGFDSGVVTIPESVVIADMVDGLRVKEIGNHAFANNHKLKRVVIPAGVTRVEEYAFANCDYLTTVNFEGSRTLHSIDASAFENCLRLKYINIPKSVTFIGIAAFANCDSLTSFILPEGLGHITDSLFEDSNTLASVNIPRWVTTIGSHAFSGCNLSSLTFEQGSQLSSIGEEAFYGGLHCSSLTLPEGVAVIGALAFYECGIKSCTIPSTVSQIGEYAFAATSFTFNGTTAQWNAIEKSDYWCSASRYTVECIDGTITS